MHAAGKNGNPKKMIRRLIGVVCYVSAVLFTIGWMINAAPMPDFNNSNKKHYISILLVALLWTAPFLLFKRPDNNKVD